MMKDKSINNKDGDWEEVLVYAEDLSLGNNPETLPWNSALLYIEASININEASNAGDFTILESFKKSIFITVEESSITGAEAANIYSAITLKIDSAIADSKFGSDAQLYILDLDLEGFEPVTGTNMINYNIVVHAPAPIPSLPPSGGCGWPAGGYKAMNSHGKCVAPYGTSDAAEQLDIRLNNSVCNNALDVVGFWNPITVVIKGYQSTNNLWSGTTDSECIPSYQLAGDENEIKSLLYSNQPSSHMIKGVNVAGRINSNGIYYHEAELIYTQNP